MHAKRSQDARKLHSTNPESAQLTRSLEYAAYPTLGEMLRFVIGALDLRARGETTEKKKLDRAAREGDFDAETFDELVVSLVETPLLEEGDPQFGHFVTDFIRRQRPLYAKLLGSVSADALTREQLMPLLVEGYAPRVVADFLIEAHEDGFIPLPELLLAEPISFGAKRLRVSPIRVVLEEYLWSKGQREPDVLVALLQGRSSETGRQRDKVRDWLDGVHVPDMGQLLLAVSDQTAVSGNPSSSERRRAQRLSRALRVARALEYGLAELADPRAFAAAVQRLLPEDAPVFDIGTLVHSAIVCQAQAWEGLSKLGLNTFGRLAFDVPLTSVDIEHAAELLPVFERQAAAAQAPWATEWMVRWCRARLAIWQGRWDEGLALYDLAFRAALYRAGPESGRLLREALAVAGLMRKKAHINRYVEQANALGLWPRVFRGVPITPNDGELLSNILIRSYLPYLPEMPARWNAA